MPRIAINSNTNGNIRFEKLNGRNHLVTEMRPIIGDSIMNGGLYPDAEVTATFNQLNLLPAPNRHPKVNGQNVSAFHPLATNSHNVGAFIRNPRKEGKEVYNELWVDVDIANQTDDGQEIIDKLESGDPIGVSTGLNLKKTAVNDDSLGYDWVGSEFQFDHVALLLNEKPAGGDATVTTNNDVEMVEMETNAFSLNSVKSQLSTLLNAGVTTGHVWISDVEIEDGSSGNVIYEMHDDSLFRRSFEVNDGIVSFGTELPVAVVRTVTFQELSGGDATTTTNQAEQETNMSKTAEQKVIAVVNGDGDIEKAINLLEKKGFSVVNAKEVADADFKYFVENKSAIKSLVDNAANAEDELRKSVLENNSDLSEDDVKGMSTVLLNKLVKPAAMNHQMNGGFQAPTSVATNSGEIPDYTPKYDKKGDE